MATGDNFQIIRGASDFLNSLGLFGENQFHRSDNGRPTELCKFPGMPIRVTMLPVILLGVSKGRASEVLPSF